MRKEKKTISCTFSSSFLLDQHRSHIFCSQANGKQIKQPRVDSCSGNEPLDLKHLSVFTDDDRAAPPSPHCYSWAVGDTSNTNHNGKRTAAAVKKLFHPVEESESLTLLSK